VRLPQFTYLAHLEKPGYYMIVALMI